MCCLAEDARVNGFAKLKKAPAFDSYFETHRSRKHKTPFIYALGKGQVLSWTSAPVPKKATPRVAFAWDVVMSGKYNRSGRFVGLTEIPNATLHINGKKAVEIPMLGTGDTQTSAGGKKAAVTYVFDFLKEDGSGDLTGIAVLTVPRSLVRPGKPVQFDLHAPDFGVRAFYGVIPVTDTWAFAGTVKDNPKKVEKPQEFQGTSSLIRLRGNPGSVDEVQKKLQPWAERILPAGSSTTFVNGLGAVNVASQNGRYHARRSGMWPSAWAYTKPGQVLEWTTAVVPGTVTTPLVTFALECMISSKDNGHVTKHPGHYPLDLLLNGRRVLAIEAGLAGDTQWEDGEYRAFFDMTMQDDYFDLGGILFVTVPASQVKPGQAARLSIVPQANPGRAMIMLSGFNDTIEHMAAGKVWENPDTYFNPKALTHDDFYYDGSGQLQLITPQGTEIHDHLSEVRTRAAKRNHPRLEMPCERLIFRDVYTHAEKWLLARRTGRHKYSAILAFNANGNLIKPATGGWPGLYEMSRARIRNRPFKASGTVWDAKDPDVCYGYRIANGKAWNDPSQICEVYKVNIKTGKRTILAESQGAIGWFENMSDDGKIVWWAEGGTQDHAFRLAWVNTETLETGRVSARGGVHQAYLVRAPQKEGKYYVWLQGPALVDDNGVKQPGGHRVVDLMTGTIPMGPFSGNHGSQGPIGWALTCGDAGGCYRETQPRHQVVNVVDTLEVHSSWTGFDPRWGVESYNTGSGSAVIKINPATDDVVLLCNLNENPPDKIDYYTLPFANQSPDGTKVLYSSTSLGEQRLFLVVAKRPEAPRNIRAEGGRGARVIRWTPHPLSRETRGYHVLYSRHSGGPYQVLTQEPVSGTSFNHTGAPGGPGFYRIRSVEWSGLVSGPSVEGGVDAGKAERWVFAEAEDGENTPPMRMMFDGRVSGMHFAWIALPVGERTQGELSLPVTIPAKGAYRVWLRARSLNKGSAEIGVGSSLTTVSLKPGDWQWIAVGEPVKLSKGPATLTVASETQGMMFDCVALTTAKTKPEGIHLLAGPKPSAPTGLVVKESGKGLIRLAWQAVTDRRIRYVNVYASDKAGVKAEQPNRIASVPAGEREWLDWGLTAGRTKHYVITTVDWDGRESGPSKGVKAIP